jgi:ABC-type multidrug transport system fused ATPase/permease subunit
MYPARSCFVLRYAWTDVLLISTRRRSRSLTGFLGTVRSNLDPFTDFSDSKLYECLERVGLSTARSSIASSQHSMQSIGRCRVESLDDVVKEGGSNFSVGQRQLLVIARALLHGSTIVIMDEATASVDAETDALITETMRREFSSASVITVAHRLNTIMDCDYILVMSDGIASEFNTPQNLLDKGGLFRDLVRAAARD